ncbi:hybrid sensor histidine kinase/response regulator [Fulvivirga sp. RKSG066]|uniref:hybrid sensor histidine kinase/response regulator n=1 Tax=Fulvivirga aurantia TaxID=2529383 RepID=UPI0012BCD72A|nr:hybrid sensor histidine kinase/response regulator [Fulvivirga aurantia]MTI21332.1 hybrid sensor histidine kinase/response regulator [Fulvivirga aurantia]
MTDITNGKKTEIKVFLLDDDEDDFIIVEDLLSELNSLLTISVTWEPDYEKALEIVKTSDEYDICLVDYRLGEYNGLQFIKSLRESGNNIPLILLTGQGDNEIDYEAMKLGASDYLVKGVFDAQLLGRSIRYAINHSQSVRELNANEEKYRSLFMRSVDAIYIINKEHLFIDANPSLENLLGYSRDELMKISMKDTFSSQKAYSYFNQMLAKNLHVKDFEVKLCTKDDKELDCIINSVALKDENDEIYAYQGIVHDLTVRKKAEKELLVAEKLAMTGQIARSMAHEVRNPLTNLNLAMEQLKEEVEDNEDADMYLDIIKRNARRIEQLITQMLKSSKPKELNSEEICINDVLEETIAITQDRIKLRGIKLETDFTSFLPKFSADKEQLKTAFLNIIINAIEAMEENEGVLRIETHMSADMLMVEVKDNGKGIPEHEIRKLFDPFFTGKAGGMGLGLTSTQNILNSHKAQVDVESEVGVGTTFSISFNPRN